ncbi:MAG: hypothetical protein WCF97_05260 [Nitrososphaeraceae archaeon]
MGERTEWKRFRSVLDKKDRKMFDEMLNYVKYAGNKARRNPSSYNVNSV